MNYKVLIALLLSLLFACCKDDSLLRKMEQIKRIGNEQPELAISMLDSLKMEVNNASEYDRMKYELLSIRLHDKADILHTSDVSIKKLVKYFEQKGTMQEKQEVYYYAGSVYRDLDDTPRALTCFVKSVEYAEQDIQIDSVLLRNSYSQLYALFFNVQDYSHALQMARKEAEIAQKLDILDISTILHEGATLLRIDSVSSAKASVMHAFKYMEEYCSSADIYSLTSLLYQLSSLGYLEEAYKCYERIMKFQKTQKLPTSTCLSLGRYFSESEQLDSAIYWYDTVLKNPNNLDLLYDASHNLSLIYNSLNNSEKANLYAQVFIQINDSLNLGKRQAEAATVNNLYKYHRDAEAERAVMEEGERNKQQMRMVCLISALGFLSCVIFFYYRKNKHLRQILEKSLELQQMKQKNQELLDELDETEKELQSKSKELGDKVEQNKLFLRMLHKSEMELNAEDVIRNIHEASVGRHKITAREWQQLLAAVDQLYPDFKDALVMRTESMTEEQMKFCYLLRIGLSNPQIQNVTDMSRATVWRWSKKYEDVVK